MAKPLITVLLIFHGLVATALLGAITHQALATPRRTDAGTSFVSRYRAVDASVYSGVIVVLFAVVSLLGAVLYPSYRSIVRPVLEASDSRVANGAFEIKEHLAALGLMLLPVYRAVWKRPLAPDDTTARRSLTWILAAIIWWNFLTGHVLNNIQGLFR